MPLPTMYDYYEAAAYTGFNHQYIREAKNRGEIAFVTISRKIKFTEEALDRWIAEYHTHAAQQRPST